MSGSWLTAANRTRLYQGARGDGTVSNVVTNTVLRELCSMSNTAGIVYAPLSRIADRTKVSVRTVKKAMHRLQADGWVREIRRGVGNRHGLTPRPGVYMLSRLPDSSGALLPLAPVVADAWLTFQKSRLWASARRYERPEWRQANTMRIAAPDLPVEPVDKGVYAAESEFYKVPVEGLQGACAGTLLNDGNEQVGGRQDVGHGYRPKVLPGGAPAHWRVTGRRGNLAVVEEPIPEGNP